MPSDWPLVRLGDMGVAVHDCEHLTPSLGTSGVPYVTIPDMKAGVIDVDGAKRMPETDYPKWTRRTTPQDGDVVLSRRTNPGVTAVAPAGSRYALGQNLVLLRSEGKVVDPGFLRWLCRSEPWWREVRRFLNVGAVFDSLRIRDLPEFELPVPPLSEQLRIAHILGTLDDKIELNRRMSATLEEMSRAIFKSWFVDFDPVRAKAEGRDTGLPPHIADLFPDRLVDSEFGPLPEGWTVSPFSHGVEVRSGGTPKTSVDAYWDGPVPWFSMADLPATTEAWLVNTAKSLTEAGLASIGASPLPPVATVLTARGTVGRVALVNVPTVINQSCYGLVSVDGAPFHAYFKTRAVVEELRARSHGSVFGTITRATLDSIPWPTPPVEVRRGFDETVRVLMSRMLAASSESQMLRGQRDLLLSEVIA